MLNCSDYISWCPTLLSLKNCSKNKQLKFRYNIEILQIHTMDKVTDHALVHFSHSALTQWTIERAMISSMKYCKFIKIFYEKNDPFLISLGSMGSKNNINVSLNLFKFP